MRKELLISAVLCCMAVGTVAQGRYAIKGRAVGVSDGAKVYLCKIGQRDLQPIDSAAVRKGCFGFEGTQETPVVHYIWCSDWEKAQPLDFFLEEGSIDVMLSQKGVSATGTANNDRYQALRDATSAIEQKLQELYKGMELGDTTLTEVQKNERRKMIRLLSLQRKDTVRAAMRQNISNPVGVMLLKQYPKWNTMKENEELLAKIPESYRDDPAIVKMRQNIQMEKNVVLGKKYVDFKLGDLQGNPVRLSDYVGKGKVVLIDFWASWCVPCRRSMPRMKELYGAYKDRGFEIVGVSLDSNKEAWQTALRQLELPWPQMSDLKGWDSEAARLYAVKAIPQTILIDTSGNIVGIRLSADAIEKKLDELLK